MDREWIEALARIASLVFIGWLLSGLFRSRRAKDASGAPSPPPATDEGEELEAAVAARANEEPSVEKANLEFQLSDQWTREGRIVEAEALAARVVAQVRDLPETSRRDVLVVLDHHAHLLHVLGRLDEAEAVRRRELELHDPEDPDGEVQVAQARVALATVLIPRGEHEEARRLLDAAFADCEAALASGDPSRRVGAAEMLRRIGECELELGTSDAACRAHALQVETDRDLLGDASAERIPGLEALAHALRLHGDDDEARARLEEALALAEAHRGPDHPEVSRVLWSLAMLHYETADLGRAERCLSRCLDINARHLGPHHSQLAGVVQMLAQVQRMRGRNDEALASLRRNLEIAEAGVDGDHPDLVAPLADLGSFLADRFQDPEATEILQRALAIARREEHPSLTLQTTCTQVLDTLAGFEASLGRESEAETLLRESLERREALLGGDHPEIASRCIAIADLLMSTGRLAEAEATLKRAAAILNRAFGPAHIEHLGILRRIARIHGERDDLAGAIRSLEEALEVVERALGGEDRRLLSLLDDLGNLYETAGRSAESEHARARAQLLRRTPRTQTLLN